MISAKRINEIFIACLFKEDEDKTNFIPAYGITINIGFHPERLNSHKEEVQNILNELPNEFKRSGGGGWSFLNMCVDKNGDGWGQHQNMEELLMLGLALNLANYSIPKELWGVLPGGVPYITINL